MAFVAKQKVMHIVWLFLSLKSKFFRENLPGQCLEPSYGAGSAFWEPATSACRRCPSSSLTSNGKSSHCSIQGAARSKVVFFGHHDRSS